MAGGDGRKSIIDVNRKPYGIPQGSPISDLLANMYLLDFNLDVLRLIREYDGIYLRYSDDILIMVPSDRANGKEIMNVMTSLIKRYGSNLAIKPEKSSVFLFSGNEYSQSFSLEHGTQGKNGLEYLGFRYDGKKVYIRDATLSNLQRKIARQAKRETIRWVTRFANLDIDQLKSTFKYEDFIKRFGRVEDFAGSREGYRSWTFWTYAKRARAIFSPLGEAIGNQMRRHRTVIRNRIDKEMEHAASRRKPHRSGDAEGESHSSPNDVN